MAKNLIICCDGTWNNIGQEENGLASPTNVVKIYHALAEQDSNGTTQLKYYHPGVGGEGLSWKEWLFGGAFGNGISRHIQSAYHWLACNYEENDRIYLFGFSRGAFAVRSLCSFIGLGLLDLRDTKNSDQSWHRVKTAYEQSYRENREKSSWIKPDWIFFNSGNPVNIEFLGVWDTVGALGIPDNLALFNLYDRPKHWNFHQMNPGPHVIHARHAMAIDEVRASFTVLRWDASASPDAQEIWFPGVHADVGGGYVESDLSDLALAWMMGESSRQGLAFRPAVVPVITGNPAGVMHNSLRGTFAKLRSRPRNLPAIVPGNPECHASVFTRQNTSPVSYPLYHLTIRLTLNQSITVELFAKQHWNETNVYFGVDEEYTFSSQGKWLDSRDSCGWHGMQNRHYTFGDFVRSLLAVWGKIERVYKRITGNPSADFLYTKRVEEFKWFVLAGAIANDNGKSPAVKNDGSPVSHECIELPLYEHKPFRVTSPGYLFCFPNDAWEKYENNHGSIELTITRIK